MAKGCQYSIKKSFPYILPLCEIACSSLSLNALVMSEIVRRGKAETRTRNFKERQNTMEGFFIEY